MVTPQICRSIAATAQEFSCYFIVFQEQSVIWALFGIHLLSNLFRGISVRVLYFTPSRLCSNYSLVLKRTNLEFDFEGKGILTCALRPLTLDRNYPIRNIYNLASGHKANFVIQYRTALIPTANLIEQETRPRQLIVHQHDRKKR